jgi:pSer/pThr/pTyr-binding forkhead associated (FHA) protein
VSTDAISVEQLLLILKIAFLVLLYIFIWRIVRSASRDILSPNESFVLAPGAAPGGLMQDSPLPAGSGGGRLVVVKSPTRPEGEEHRLNGVALSVGRSSTNDVELRGDGFASARHALFQPRPDGVWIEDVGSTNGTFVNGIRLERARKLTAGDVVRVGETDLRYDP